MRFPEDYVSAEPMPWGMVPQSLSERVRIALEERSKLLERMRSPYKQPFERLTYRKIKIEA